MIKEFNKENLKQIREEMNTALKAIAKKHGMEQFYTTDISFTEYEMKVKVIGSISQENNVTAKVINTGKSKELGYNSNIVGAEFIFKGDRYKVTGISSTSAKYPLEVKRVSDGKASKFTCNGTLEFTDKAIKWTKPEWA